ncbi:MAG: ATP-dependent zinc metalloprotease FtsH [Firmicutes bacterium]|nr:ATP-dependent zinc metalloprotease FtsH [Bacillota bacterium]
MSQPQRRKPRFNLIFILIAVLVVLLIFNSVNSGDSPTRINYTEFQHMIGVSRNALTGDLEFTGTNQIRAVVQRGNNFYILSTQHSSQGDLRDFLSRPDRNASHQLYYAVPFQITSIISEQIIQAPSGEAIQFESRSVPTSFFEIMIFVVPIALMLLIAFLIFRNFAGRSGISNMGKNRATVVLSSPIRFNDVAGIEEEKEEVQEIVQFLRNPRKFLELGARIPKGFLLIGQPGTGKTLLAKAIAGEAGVPFFSISGSDFSEMLVGVGPSRMRDLFEQAKLNAPCIIFIDEIDSIARMRGVGISGAAEENEQTLNQLLVQMDGFTKSEGVIVLAATNRADVLDQALLRPGRFDRQIIVQMPDVSGREKILKVHTKNKPISSDVDLKRVSQIISGFSGADIENLMNESAIIAAKKDRRKITMADITEGINKVLLGPQKRSRIITDEDKKITAYHEAGHAVVSRVLQDKQTVQEVSIIPRGMAAGYTLTNDKDDVTAHKSKSFLKTQLAVYMGGRVAEKIFIGDICTGATQDLKYATGLAERMVTMFGMSDDLGPVYYGRSDEALLRVYDNKTLSDSLQATIDKEVKALVLEAEATAIKIMKDYKSQIDTMVEILLERETIYAEDIDLIMQGKKAKEIIAGIEARLEKAREVEQREKIECEIEELEIEFNHVREIAKAFHDAKAFDDKRMEQLEKNFELARDMVKRGEKLPYMPTVDNIQEYAKLIKAPKQTKKKPTTIKELAQTPQEQTDKNDEVKE